MKVLKNPVFAVFFAVLLVISSSLISSGMKLDKECRKVTDGFYQGVKYDGYKHSAIYTQLKNICGAASGLVTVADNYGIDTREVSEREAELSAAVSDTHGGISSICKKYAALSEALTRLERELDGVTLSSRDEDGFELYVSTIENAGGVIDSSGYNESVHSYISGCDAWKRMFISLTNTHLPELFA